MVKEKFDFKNYDFKRNLLFCWKPWIWKTFLAKKILEKFEDKNLHNLLKKYSITDAYFKQLVKTNALVLRKPEDFSASLEFYPLELMTRCKIMLYDDIWVSDVTDAYLRDLTFILDTRLEKWLVTIFTTNLTWKELKEKLNERIFSRLLCNCDVITMQWEDRRLQTTRYFEI